MNNTPLVISKIVLIANIIFWTAISVYFSFFKFAGNENYLMVKILLFFEPLFFTIAFIGLIKEIKIIYLLSIIFVFVNAILSITDEIGIYDVISLFLNITAFISLFMAWRQIFKKKIISPYGEKDI